MSHNHDEQLAPFKALFNSPSHRIEQDLATVYHDAIRFRDPFIEVRGLTALEHYFREAYSNVISCTFDFDNPLLQNDQATLPWVMRLRHRRLRGGDEVMVEGISHLQFSDGLVSFHRDYFDAGQLLYENVPILGTAVRWLRRRAA